MTHDEIFQTLESTAGKLTALLGSYDERELEAQRDDGHWSIKEVVGHLYDDGQLFSGRINRILDEIEPRLPAYDGPSAMAEAGYNAYPLAQLTEGLGKLDSALVARLRSLKPSDWERTGEHQEYGTLILTGVVEDYAAHEQEHLAEIEQRVRELAS